MLPFSEATVFLKIVQNSQKNTCAGVSGCRPLVCNFVKKETPAQLLFCKFCKNFRNTSQLLPLHFEEVIMQNQERYKKNLYDKMSF